MSDTIDINVNKIVETIDVFANFEHPNVEINTIEIVDNVEINATPNVVQININTISGGGAEWGEIEGILSNQTDLQNALDLKANASDLGDVAFSNDYNDLDNLPTIPNNLEELHNVTETNYTTPIDSDSLLTFDITNSLWKRLSWANIKSNLKTYFDTIYQATLGFTPENVANKSTDVNLGTSDVLYPTQNAVKTYVDGKKEKVIFYNRSTWTFPNVASAPFPLISSTNFELSTANLNFTTDNALTALASLSPWAMPIGIAPFDCKLKRVTIEGRQIFGSWQGFTLRTVIGSNRTVNITNINVSNLDNQVVDEFNFIPPISGNAFNEFNSTSSVIIPKGHGIIVFMSFSRTGISIAPVLNLQIELEKV